MKKCNSSEKNTFIVKIDHCQQGSWQGKVIWAEGNRSERFRSALELIKLMDEAVTMSKQAGLEQEHSAS